MSFSLPPSSSPQFHAVLISGLPSTGRSALRHALVGQGRQVVNLERGSSRPSSAPTLHDLGLAQPWDSFLRGEDSTFTRLVKDQNIVLEWAYAPLAREFAVVKRLHAAGIAAWWLDGHIPALLHNHVRARRSEHDFLVRLALIASVWTTQLLPFYRDRVIQRVKPDGTYLPDEEVLDRMFAAQPLSALA